MEEYPTDFVSIGTVEDVYTTHVTHQEQFYVHLDTRSRILEEIMDKLETRYSHLGPNDKTLPQIKPGGLCAAKFTDDNNWYRAKVTGVHNNGLIEVNFVDYGNTDYVGADRVKKLDIDLMHYPVQSYRCALSGVSCPHGLWTPELRVQFEDLVIDKQCTAVFKEKAGEDIYQLDMFDEQGNHINKLFGAPERKKPVANVQATRNGRHTEQGFDTVVWKEGQIVPAIVVYVKSPDMFWCQEVVHTNNILVLSEELSRLHMTQEMGPLQDIRPGAICAAKFHVDDDWYRGIIQSLSRNEAQVYFVDYGNTETVSLDSICELKPQFRILPALAVKCSLSSPGSSGGGNWGPGATDEFEKLVVDKELELNVLQRYPDGYNVSLLDVVENRDVGNQLKDKILSKGGIKSKSSTNIDKVNNNNSNSQSQSKSRGLDFRVGSTSDVFLSWIDNPSDFWVQLDSASDTLDKLSSDLQEYYAQPRPAALSAPGAFVIARYSDDQRWYRGLVVKEFDDVVKVLFIDYGNTDTIPKSELRQVNPQFGQIDPLAFRCSLKGIKPLPQDNSWSVDAKDFLEKLTANGCQCEVLSKNEAYRFVNLKADGRDITQELVSLAVVAGSQLPTTKSTSQSYLPSSKLDENQTEQVLVTHIDSPHCIWVQFKKSSSDLDVVMEKLENHYSEEGGTPVTKPAVGQACVAQYSLDSAWYRAVIMNITPSGCNVHFVDYGNKELVAPSKVCLAEPRFLDLPSQAIRCSLPLQGDVSNLTDMLSDLVLEKDVSLKVLAVGGEVPTVDLIVEGESVCGLLRIRGASFVNVSGKSSGHEGGNVQVIKPVKPIPEGSTVVAFTSMVHNPGRFFLQLSGIDDELSSLMDRIATKYVPQGIPVVSQPSVGTYCVALYQDDNQWYRGKITSVNGDTCQILFVDYGNEEFVEIGSVKVMTPEISNCPILAYECSLHGIHADEWSESSIEYFESIVMDQELKCTFNTPSQVTISCNGEDVATKLVSAGHCRRTTTAASSPLAVSTSGFGGGSRPKNSPGFGQSPKKEESSPRGFGGGKRDERGFRENREENREFGGRRQNNFGEGRDEKREFGGGGNRFGEDRENKRGFGGDRRDGRGFGGEGREDRGGRRFGGGDESGSHRSDEGSEKGGFKSRSRDGEDSGFGGRRGGGDGGTGFGGGRRERNVSADSSASGATADKFTYADPPSGPENAILVHIDDDGTFYLQLPSMEKDILFLSKRLAGSYKSGGPRLKGTAEKGTICCCKFPDDGSMYRCQVEGIDGNKVLVRYMDFGNIAEHSTYDLKFLFPDLLQYPAQAFPCKLRGLDWSLDQAEKFASVTLDKDLEVTFTSTSAPFEVDIKTPDGDLLSIMTGKIAPPAPKICSPSQGGGAFGAKSPKGFGSRGGMDTSTPKKFDSPVKSLRFTSSSPAKPSLPKQIFISQTAPLESQTAFISHISEDGHFYLQLEKDTDLLESLTEKLKNLDSNTPHPDLSKGAACGAVFSEDSSWYRAKISEVTNDQCTVTFVDFGNGDKVSKQNIRPLSGDLLTAAPLAYQCSFAGEDEALSNKSKEKLEEFLMEHQLTVSFNNQSAPFTVSAKTSDGQDLRDIVCPSNQFRSHIIPKDVTPVGVSHIEEDGRFYVCFYKQYKAKENLLKRLSEHYSSADVESVENPEIDSPCCFKSTVDDQWHRCIIKSINDSKAEVRYVDWGKQDSADTSDLRLLPINFLKEPPFALECRLKGVESWTDDLKEKFIDMTKDKILNATFYTSKPPYRVSLARSIELDLLGLSAPEPDSPRKMVDDSVVSNANMNRSAVFQGGDCYITETTPEGMFYAQLVSEEDQLQSLSDSLDALLATEHTEPDTVEVGNMLCAKFTEDDVWYRASVEEVDGDNFTVRFVDYGNTDSLSKNRLASLPDELSTISIPAFAYKCKLSSPLSSVEEFKGAVLDKVVSIEIVSSEEDSVFSVNVTHDGQPIGVNQATSTTQRSSVFQGGNCYITETTPEGMFYGQLVSEEDQLQSLSDSLDALLATEHTEPDTVEVGNMLCAKFTEDDVWYRASVEEVDGDNFTVRFVDYGNTDSLSKNRLASLPDELSTISIPAFAYKCKLSSPLSSVEEFKGAVLDKVVSIEIVSSEEDSVFSVNVTHDGQPIGGNKATAATQRSSVFQGGNCYITETTPEGMFYAQLVSEEDQLQSLSDSLDALLATEHTEPDTVEVGNMLCAKFTEDDVWYRASVEEVDGDNFTVRFVDYGNTDSLSKNRLASLPDELSTISIPAFAYKCKLSSPLSSVEEFKGAVLDKVVSIEIVSSEEDSVFSVNVTHDGQPIGVNEATAEEPSTIPEEIVKSASSERKAVIIPFVTSPGQFYVQLQDDENQLDSMMNDLYEDITGLAEGEGLVSGDLAIGDLCAALYEESWYRVKVVSCGEGDQSVQVLYVDHGNTETVSDRADLRALPDKYQSLPLFGHEATLSGVKPVDEDWTEEAIEAFRALVEEKSLLADLLDVNDKPWVVHLLDMGTPVQDTLVAKGYAVATGSFNISKSTKQVFSETDESSLIVTEAFVPNESDKIWKNKIGCISDKVEELKEVKAFVSHADNPSQIWCQLASSSDELEELADRMETLYSTPQDSDNIIGDISNGALVVGLFEDDGSRYRSVVVSKNSDNDKVLLRFIDYGNCGLCSRDQIFNIREELCNQPILSFSCCLDKIQPLEEEWSSEVCNRFVELTTDQELLLTLVGRKQDGTALIDLIVPETGKSLSEVLIEEGLVNKSLDIDSSLPVARHETDKCDESECLEITQPIMESTAMVDEATSNNYQDYSFGYADDGYYRNIELNLHSSYAITVCNDELPNAFCVQLKELEGQLSTLTAEIQEYVDSHVDNDYSPKIGDPCLVQHENEWQRALIRMDCNDMSYFVYAVDIGWELSIKRDKMRSMPTQFLDLPGQAIHCYLAGVVSLEPEWSLEAIDFFTDYIKDHDHHINVLESAEDGKYGVSMTTMQDSSTEYAGASLNQLMVDLGYSDVVPGSNLEVQYDMERTLDSDMLDELEESFKGVETEKNMENKEKSSETDASASQVDTFATTQEEDKSACKAPLEVGSQFYQFVHLSKSETENRSLAREEKNSSDEMALTKKDLAFNIASAVDRIDQMGCIDLFPEDVLSFDLTSDVDSIFDVSKEIKSLPNKDNEEASSIDKISRASIAKPQSSCNGNKSDTTPTEENNSLYSYTWSQPASPESYVPTTAVEMNDIGNFNNNNEDEMSTFDTDGIDNGEKSDIYGQNEEIPKCLIKMEFNKLNNGTVNVNEGSNTPNDTSEHGNVNNALEIDPNEVVQALSITQEEKQLLPYEYYEKLESQEKTTCIKAVNGSDVHSHLYDVDCIENYLQTDTKSKDGETSLVHNTHILTVYQTGSHISDAKMDGSTIEDIVEDIAERGDIGRSLTDQIYCNGTALEKDRNEFENYQDVNASGGETVETFESEDASYLTLDQTGYVDIENEAGLTDGYHGSPSDGVSGPDVLPSDCTHSLEEDNSLRAINSYVKDSDNSKNLYGVQDCEQFEDSFVENEYCEVDSVSYDIAKVTSSGNFIMRICYEEDGEIPTTISYQLNDVKDSMEERVEENFTGVEISNQTESPTYVEHGMNIGVIDKDDIHDSELCVGRRENSNSLIKSSVIKDIDGYLDRDTEKDSALINFEEQEIEVMDVCDGITEQENEEMDVCEGNVGGIPENISSSGAFDAKNSSEDINSFLSNEIKFGLNDDDGKSIDLLEVATPGSPDGNSLEGSMFESCLEPNSSGSCQEGIINDPCQASDVTVDLEEISVQEINTEESLVCVDPKCTSVVEAVSASGGEEEKEGEDEGEDGHVTSVSTLDDTYDNYESASETFEDFDRTDSFYNSSGCLVIDESTEMTDSSLDRSGLESSDCGPESSSCYDTSSLVFSDSQLDSSYADTSNTSASTQTTEVSGYSIVDTSTFNDTSTSQCDESDLTAEEGSVSSLSLNCAVKLSSDSKLYDQGESFTDIQNVSTEGLEKSKICENQGSDNQVSDVQQISTICPGGENEYEQGQDVGNSNIRTLDNDFISSAAGQIPLNEPEQHRNKTEDHDRVNKDNGDAVVMTCRNEVVIDDQDEEKGDEAQMPEMAEAFRNEPLSQSLSYRVERDVTNTDKGSKVDSEHSGPASFHSVDDEEEEVIRGNLEESDPADAELAVSNEDIDENDTEEGEAKCSKEGDEVETNESEGQQQGKNTLDAESKESNEAETTENVNNKEGQQTMKATEKVPNEESCDNDKKDEMGQCDITAKEVKVVQSYDEAEAESLADKDESEA